MTVTVHFYSYFKDLSGCSTTTATLPESSTIKELLGVLGAQFPKLEPMWKCALVAVGVEYQERNRMLTEGDEVSLFPPVQGG